MGEMYMQKLDSPWELSVIENAGEIPAAQVKDELAVKTAPLMTDIKSQLMLIPRTLSYTVGWRALVWQNKESGAFLDLTEEEYDAYISGGIVSFTRGSEQDVKKDEGTNGDSGSNTL
jgi:hypothetical protein